MSPGSEPERDDTGLPRVDVEIPDDARELDRDVQAYHREQRAQRRHSRSSRLHRLMSRDGIALPLLSCCLIFALITGTLLTVFTASGIDQGMPGAPGTGKPGTSLPVGSAGAGVVTGIPTITPAGRLPAATIIVSGLPVPLQGLRSAAVLLVPVTCNCAAALAELAAMMTRVRVTTLLVAPQVAPVELTAALRSGAKLATDPTGALLRYPHVGLTAILVSAGGAVQYADGLVAGDNMAALLPAAGGLNPGIEQVPARR